MRQDGRVIGHLLLLVWRAPEATPTDFAQQLRDATGSLQPRASPWRSSTWQTSTFVLRPPCGR